MAKNRTMAQKHAKAKKEAVKDIMTNTYAFMASSRNASPSASWAIHHKPYATR